MTYIYTEYDYLAHHGIKGMRWGVRRFQNEDGSLKSAGEKRYYGSSKGSTRSSGRSDSVKKRKGMSSRTKKALAIAGVAAGTAALAYGVNRYRKAHGSGGNGPDAFLRSTMNQKLNPARREKLLKLEQKYNDAKAARRKRQEAKAANRDPDKFLRGVMNQKLDPAKRQKMMDDAVAKRREIAAKAAKRDPDKFLRSTMNQKLNPARRERMDKFLNPRRNDRLSKAVNKKGLNPDTALKAMANVKAREMNNSKSMSNKQLNQYINAASKIPGTNMQFTNFDEFDKLMRSNKKFKL